MGTDRHRTRVERKAATAAISLLADLLTVTWGSRFFSPQTLRDAFVDALPAVQARLDAVYRHPPGAPGGVRALALSRSPQVRRYVTAKAELLTTRLTAPCPLRAVHRSPMGPPPPLSMTSIASAIARPRSAVRCW